MITTLMQHARALRHKQAHDLFSPGASHNLNQPGACKAWIASGVRAPYPGCACAAAGSRRRRAPRLGRRRAAPAARAPGRREPQGQARAARVWAPPVPAQAAAALRAGAAGAAAGTPGTCVQRARVTSLLFACNQQEQPLPLPAPRRRAEPGLVRSFELARRSHSACRTQQHPMFVRGVAG